MKFYLLNLSSSISPNEEIIEKIEEKLELKNNLKRNQI